MSARRLTDSIWLIDTGAVYDCHVYLVDGGSAAALIDCGTGLATDELIAAVDETGCRERLTDVFVTHYHADHAGGAAAIRSSVGIRIRASAETAAALSAGDEDASQVGAARDAGIYPSDYRYQPCPVDGELSDGEARQLGAVSITAYKTPGHCAGHLCFVVDDGDRQALCSGDAVFHDGRIAIQPIPDCNPYLYSRTVQRLARLPVELLLPGHGEIVLEQGSNHVAAAAAAFRRMVPPPNLHTGDLLSESRDPLR